MVGVDYQNTRIVSVIHRVLEQNTQMTGVVHRNTQMVSVFRVFRATTLKMSVIRHAFNRNTQMAGVAPLDTQVVSVSSRVSRPNTPTMSVHYPNTLTVSVSRLSMSALSSC